MYKKNGRFGFDMGFLVFWFFLLSLAFLGGDCLGWKVRESEGNGEKKAIGGCWLTSVGAKKKK